MTNWAEEGVEKVETWSLGHGRSGRRRYFGVLKPCFSTIQKQSWTDPVCRESPAGVPPLEGAGLL